MTSFQRKANWLTCLLMVILVALCIWGSVKLPSPIPIHFNQRGQPNRWAGATTLPILPVIAGCLIGLFWAIVKYTPTQLMNIPGPRTPENLNRQRQNFDQLIATFQVLITGMFVGDAGQILWISFRSLKQIAVWPSLLFMGLMVVSLLAHLVRSYRLIPR